MTGPGYGAAQGVPEGGGAVSDGRILLVCSAGGHLAQLLRLRAWWIRFERLWVTFDGPHARSVLGGELVAWAHHPTTRNVPNLVRNLWLAARILPRFRPHLVVSDGAGVAVPFFLVAKLLRIPTAYVEVVDRMDSATLTGRMCAPLADAFLLQWEEQARVYPRGRVIGRLV